MKSCIANLHEISLCSPIATWRANERCEQEDVHVLQVYRLFKKSVFMKDINSYEFYDGKREIKIYISAEAPGMFKVSRV